MFQVFDIEPDFAEYSELFNHYLIKTIYQKTSQIGGLLPFVMVDLMFPLRDWN